LSAFYTLGLQQASVIMAFPSIPTTLAVIDMLLALYPELWSWLETQCATLAWKRLAEDCHFW